MARNWPICVENPPGMALGSAVFHPWKASRKGGIGMDDLIEEFLIESRENLDRMERELVALEKDPASRHTLASIFRMMHTLKGTCGFFSFDKLEAIAHAAENLLSLLRAEKLTMTAAIASALLAAADLIREILASIEMSGLEGNSDGAAIVERLTQLQADEPSPTSEAAFGAPAEGGMTASAESTVRVSVTLLDQLMNLVGELVLTRNQIVQSAAKLDQTVFAGAAQRLNLVTSELQERVMKTRMEPIGNVWNKFPRLVRDLEQTCGKKVHLAIQGASTEIDRTLLEAIRDPLTHLLRNAIDHGIETPEDRRAAGKPEQGTLSLRAYHEGGLVYIEMTDDGAGIDPERVAAKAVQRGLVTNDQAARLNEREAIELIFLPGFSTAEKVSTVSGRGVGLDVVKTHIERVGGIVDVATAPGRGATFKIKIPLTLAIIPALTVSCYGDRYAIPQVNVVELLLVERSGGLESIQGALVHRLRGSLLPVLHLAHELGFDPAPAEGDAMQIVVVQAGERRFGLIVDDVHDAGEIVVKPLGKLLEGTPGLAGATIMGDGAVALILDVFSLARRADLIAAEAVAHSAIETPLTAAPLPREELLLFGVGARRLAMLLSDVARLEEFPRQSIEFSGGRTAVQYRGGILPLISVADFLKVTPADEPDEPVHAIVYTENGRSAGLVVSSIAEIVREASPFQRGVSQRGVLGSAVVESRLTDLIDVRTIIRTEVPTFFEEAAR